jgi:hypothetical protein
VRLVHPESGGSYDVTFGDVVQKGNIVNKIKLKTPEQLYNKKLTEMTLKEVYEFQKSNTRVKMQLVNPDFVKNTLFDNNGNIQKQFTDIPGVSLNSKFTAICKINWQKQF